jgi:hypothetical protein
LAMVRTWASRANISGAMVIQVRFLVRAAFFLSLGQEV